MNSSLTPSDVRPGSNKKVWWRCNKNATHEWVSTVANRVSGNGCPMCAGRRVAGTPYIQNRYPKGLPDELAVEWHPTKNGSLTPEHVTIRSSEKVWWSCRKNCLHEWQATISNRTAGNGCPICSGKLAGPATSLEALYPTIAAEWHPTKNAPVTPHDVRPGSGKKVWWLCRKNPSHQWQAEIVSRTAGRGCPMCSGNIVTSDSSVKARHPEIAAEWHPTKNGPLTPDQVLPHSDKKAWWMCRSDPSHEWQSSVSKRTAGRGCPICSGKLTISATSLQALSPEIAMEWHPTKNVPLTPDRVRPGSGKKVWWQCSKDPSHEWQTRIDHRARLGSGCPFCNSGWTIDRIRAFVASLTKYLAAFTPAELYLLFQQNGLLDVTGKSKAFVKALATGRFPLEEIENFVEGRASLVDRFVEDRTQTLEANETTTKVIKKGFQGDDSDNPVVEAEEIGDDAQLPLVHANMVLQSLGAPVVTSADEEAVGFLLESAKAKIWKHVFHDERDALSEIKSYSGTEYAEQVRADFLSEYQTAKNLKIPDGYSFSLNHHIALPNLMQRLVTVRLKQRHRIGNWSGTGAGKTLSAVLAGRIVGAKFTVICCPNSVVDGWKNTIFQIFPDSVVATKTFTPDWPESIPDETGMGATADPNRYRYLILNYEAFQQPNSEEKVLFLAKNEDIDYVVVDEIHFAKQRHVEDMSKRKRLVTALINVVGERNPDLCVLGMSATPVINNLQEGKSLAEMITGASHADLNTRPTVPNCMQLHQQLVRLGIRWLPEYDVRCEIDTPEIDCRSFIDDIRALGKKGTPLALEQILTQVRLPTIRKEIEPKTLIYTHYIQGIDRILWQALLDDGWKVGFYTGDDKSGLDQFIEGDLDVLIGSSAVGTGLDGLQKVCNKLIVNVLPWTNAEFEQLKGRIYRQGQTREKVRIVVPITYADIGGSRWSWCESKMHRLRFKKSIADAAVDGVVPEGHLRTPAQAYQDVMGWLERLESGKVTSIVHPKIIVPLPDDDESDVRRRKRRYGDFSTMNRKWNQSNSQETHKRLLENPEEWEQYHTFYRESRKDWAVIPYEEIIQWCERRSDYVIGDFGCGEAKLAEALSDRHTVYSFDHIAINQDVVECDIAHIPLDDETLDVAVFSLSLMGRNFIDYIREAYRTLKLDGSLHIIEATSRFRNLADFTKGLKQLGFSIVETRDLWKFTHIHAIKTENPPAPDFQLTF